MTPERHQRLCDLVYYALELDEREREAFLSRECSTDVSLRQEVDSLLRSSEDVRSTFLRSSSLHLALKPGTKFDDYEVESLLGSGGMGEVYRARDLRLGREVAIKVLPAYFSSDPKRLLRFEQEARAAAALNHSNILAVFQLGEHESAPYLVSELLEGETLREKINRGRLPVGAAVDFAIQIGKGLTAAHEKGIIHRDLKPENLFVTKDGRVKILDFGLAKLTQSPWRIEQGVDSLRPGAELATEPGVVMGTVGYMSPEQAHGYPSDARSDIFALGAVLYEMLTGRRAFQGSSAADTISAILNRRPPAISGPASRVPSALQRIVYRCLEKNPDQRFQSASDLVQKLGTIPAGRGHALLLTVVAVVATLLITIASFRNIGLTNLTDKIFRHDTPTVSFRKPTERNLTANAPDNPVRQASISRDGKYVAYTDNSKKVTLLLVDTGDVRQLLLDSSYDPVDWFPDGVHLLVQRQSEPLGLWTFSTWDSRLQKVWDEQVRDVSVSPDGSSIAFIKSPHHHEIWLMGAGGEEPHKVLQFDPQDSIWNIAWSPKGDRLAYIRVRGPFLKHEAFIETADVRGDSRRSALLSEPSLLANDGTAGLTWLADGRLIYGVSTKLDEYNFFVVEVNPASGKRVGQPNLLTDWGGYTVPGVQASADGRRLIALKRHSEDGIYVGSLAAEAEGFHAKRLLEDRWRNVATAWTPDSKGILLSSQRNGRYAIYRQNLSTDQPETVIAGAENYRDPIISATRTLFYTAYGSADVETSASDWRLMGTQIEGGPRSILMNGRYSYCCGYLPSSRCMVGDFRDNQLNIFNLDAIKGKGEQIASITDNATKVFWSLSPDSFRIAIVDTNGALRILDLRTGKITPVQVRGWQWRVFSSVGWAADGRGLFAIANSPSSWALVSISNDGKLEVLHQVHPDHAMMSGAPIASPNGRLLAFTKRIYISDLIMLENF
jgi:eukaryotic-like serine/threonine-protein kinase